jgi:PAS domain S-box-containing protein
VDRPGSDLTPPDTLLAACLEHSRELMLITDRAGRWQWANARFRQVVGIEGELSGDVMSLPDQGPRGDLARAAVSKALEAGALPDTDIELQSRCGDSVWVRASVHASDDQLAWTMLDIGEQRSLSVRVRHLDELLELVQDFGRLGVWERDIATGTGRWDRRVFGFWGLDPSRGTPDFDAASLSIHPEDRAGLADCYRASLRQAGRYGWRFRVNHPDGGIRWIHSQWQVSVCAAGRPQRTLGTMVDDTEVYELARSLGAASAQLKRAVALADIAIWRHDLGSGRIFFNDRAFGVLGLPVRPEGMPLDEVQALIHPDDRAEVIGSAHRALQTDRPVHLQARYLRADGSWRHMLMRRVVQRAANGTPMAFVGVALDVTEQVLNQQENAKLSQRLELAAAAAGIGIWTLDLESDEGDWNEQMFAMCGLAPESPMPSRAEWDERFVHPDDLSLLHSARARWLAGESGQVDLEYRIVRADGDVRWQAHRVRAERFDKRSLLIGVVLDITEQRRAQQALRDADQRAALAARSAGIGTWEVRLDNGEERWDEQMFRLRQLEPAARPPSREQRLAMLHPEDRSLSIDAHADAFSGHQPWHYEFRVILPDGGVRWLASRSIAVEDKQGKLTRRLGVNWDITEAKAAETARQQAAVSERASQAKSQFLSRMSHELRTPLNAVLGFSQLLQMQAQASHDMDQVAKLGHIRAAGLHLLSLIGGVLDLSSMESGELPLQLTAVDLPALMQRALPLVMPLAQQHAVTLRMGTVSGAVQADATRLLQVIVNLLSNAIKYNRPGGEVLVEARRASAALDIVVRDTGQGMSEEQLAHLFEPFNRLGAEHSGIEGSGIGLTIVKSLIEAMGGSISVRSQPGQGTSVQVSLAAASAQPAAPEDAKPEQPATQALLQPPSRRQGQLLYIEDNSVNIMLVEELVRTLPGLDIVSEVNGVSGVSRAKSLRPDLVLVDMQLPDIDGFEVLRRLRAEPQTAALPCIALSANAMPEDIEQALRTGFAEYWTKPIDFKHFVAAIDRWFPPSPVPPP